MFNKFINEQQRFTYSKGTTPQQSNGHDCGIYVCVLMILISKHGKNFPHKIRSEHIDKLRYSLVSPISYF